MITTGFQSARKGPSFGFHAEMTALFLTALYPGTKGSA